MKNGGRATAVRVSLRSPSPPTLPNTPRKEDPLLRPSMLPAARNPDGTRTFVSPPSTRGRLPPLRTNSAVVAPAASSQPVPTTRSVTPRSRSPMMIATRKIPQQRASPQKEGAQFLRKEGSTVVLRDAGDTSSSKHNHRAPPVLPMSRTSLSQPQPVIAPPGALPSTQAQQTRGGESRSKSTADDGNDDVDDLILEKIILAQLIDAKREYIIQTYLEDPAHIDVLHRPIRRDTLIEILCSSDDSPSISPRSSSVGVGVDVENPSGRSFSPPLHEESSLYTARRRASRTASTKDRELLHLIQRCNAPALALQGETLATLMRYDLPKDVPLLQKQTLQALAAAATGTKSSSSTDSINPPPGDDVEEGPAILTEQQIRSILSRDAFLMTPVSATSSSKKKFMDPLSSPQKPQTSSFLRCNTRLLDAAVDYFVRFNCANNNSSDDDDSSSNSESDDDGEDSDRACLNNGSMVLGDSFVVQSPDYTKNTTSGSGGGRRTVASVVVQELVEKLSLPTEKVRYSRHFSSSVVLAMRTLGSSIVYLALLLFVIIWVSGLNLHPRYATWLAASTPTEPWMNYCTPGGVVKGFCFMEYRDVDHNVVSGIEAARYFHAEFVNDLWKYARPSDPDWSASSSGDSSSGGSGERSEAGEGGEGGGGGGTAAEVPFEGSWLIGGLMMRISPTVEEPPTQSALPYSCADNNLSTVVAEPYLSANFDCSSWDRIVIPFNVTKEEALKMSEAFLFDLPEWTIASIILQYAMYDPSDGNIAWVTASLGVPRYGGIVPRVRVEVFDNSLHLLIVVCMWSSLVLVVSDIAVFVALYTYRDGFGNAVFNICLRLMLFGFIAGSYGLLMQVGDVRGMLQADSIVPTLDSIVSSSQQAEMLFALWIFCLIAIVTQFIGHIEGLQLVVKLVGIILPELLGLFVVFGFFYVAFLMIAMISFGSTIDDYSSLFNTNAALIQYFFLDTNLESFVQNYPETGFAFYYVFRCFLLFVVTNFCIVTIIAPIKTVWLEGDLPIVVANVWVHSSSSSRRKTVVTPEEEESEGEEDEEGEEMDQALTGTMEEPLQQRRRRNTRRSQRPQMSFYKQAIYWMNRFIAGTKSLASAGQAIVLGKRRGASVLAYYRALLRRAFRMTVSLIVFFVNSTPLFLRHWLRYSKLLNDLYSPNTPMPAKVAACHRLLTLRDDSLLIHPYDSDMLTIAKSTRAAENKAGLYMCCLAIASESSQEWLRDARLLHMLNTFDEDSTRLEAAFEAPQEESEPVAPIVSKADIERAVGGVQGKRATASGATGLRERGSSLARNPNAALHGSRDQTPATPSLNVDGGGTEEEPEAGNDEGIIPCQFHFTQYLLDRFQETDFFNERYFLLYTLLERLTIVILYVVMVTTVVNTRRDVAYFSRNLHSGLRDLPYRQSCDDVNCTTAFTKRWDYMDNLRLDHLRMFGHRRLQYSLYRSTLEEMHEEEEMMPNLSDVDDELVVTWDSYIFRQGPVYIRQLRGVPVPCIPLPTTPGDSEAKESERQQYINRMSNCSSNLVYSMSPMPMPSSEGTTAEGGSLLDPSAYEYRSNWCPEDKTVGTFTVHGFYNHHWPCGGYIATIDNASQLLYALDHWLDEYTRFVGISMEFHSQGKGSGGPEGLAVQYNMYAELMNGGSAGQFFVRTSALSDPYLDTLTHVGIGLMVVDFLIGLIGVGVPLLYTYRHDKKQIITLRTLVFVVYIALAGSADISVWLDAVAGLILIIWLTCLVLFKVIFPAALFVFRRVTIVNEFIALALLRVAQLVPLFSLLVTAFAIAGHIMWGSRLKDFATLYHSFLSVLEGLLGDFTLVDPMFSLDANFAMVYTLLMLTVMVILSLNLLLAVIAGCAEEAREGTKIVGPIEAVASLMQRRVYYGPMFGVLMSKFLVKSVKRQQERNNNNSNNGPEEDTLAEYAAQDAFQVSRSQELQRRQELRNAQQSSLAQQPLPTPSTRSQSTTSLLRHQQDDRARRSRSAAVYTPSSTSDDDQRRLTGRGPRVLPVQGVFGYILRMLFPSAEGTRAQILRRLLFSSTSAAEEQQPQQQQQQQVRGGGNVNNARGSQVLLGRANQTEAADATAHTFAPLILHTTETRRLPLPLECLSEQITPMLLHELVDILHVGRQPEAMQCSSVAFILQQYQRFCKHHPEKCYLDKLKETALTTQALKRARVTQQQAARRSSSVTRSPLNSPTLHSQQPLRRDLSALLLPSMTPRNGHSLADAVVGLPPVYTGPRNQARTTHPINPNTTSQLAGDDNTFPTVQQSTERRQVDLDSPRQSSREEHPPPYVRENGNVVDGDIDALLRQLEDEENTDNTSGSPPDEEDAAWEEDYDIDEQHNGRLW